MKHWFNRTRTDLPVLLLLSGGLFFVIYPINFSFLPTFTSRLIALAVILYALFEMVRTRTIRIGYDRNVLVLLALWFLLFIWVTWRTLQTGFEDFNWFVNTLLLLLQVATCSLFFAWWFFDRGYSFRFMVRVIQVCLVIQACFIIFYFFSWEFKHFTLRFIPEAGNVPALHPYRSRGLTHNASASLAALQATGLLLTVYLIVKARSWKEMLPDMLAAAILVGSIFLTGRSGFLVLPFLLLFFVLHMAVTRRIGKRFTTWVVTLPVVLLAAFLTMELVYTQLGGWAAPWGGGDAFRSMTQWTFDEYEQLMTEGRSRTTDILIQNHWFFPQEAELLMLGDPRSYEVRRVSSDIGVVRRIFGIGVIGSLLTWLLVIGLLGHTAHRAMDPGERLLILVFGAWIFLLEFKEPFITDFRFATIYLMFFFYLCVMPLQPKYRLRSEELEEEP